MYPPKLPLPEQESSLTPELNYNRGLRYHSAGGCRLITAFVGALLCGGCHGLKPSYLLFKSFTSNWSSVRHTA